ncbi:Integrator complex subunit 8 [Thelohanellus kitauei]|uniref:Integrator complex subunit 8 n=1 Tax=Thelohanellus kitauei TaxID=669202 RepID=A0A0C2I8C5_THEKT|nr:Integrator complex subunit 8 [Thelohanellus kitauei]
MIYPNRTFSSNIVNSGNMAVLESELSIFKVENNQFIKSIQSGELDPFEYCSLALDKIIDGASLQKNISDDRASQDEFQLVAAEKHLYSKKYVYMSLVAAYMLDWDLSAISNVQNLTPELTELLEHLKNTAPKSCELLNTIVKQKSSFSLPLPNLLDVINKINECLLEPETFDIQEFSTLSPYKQTCNDEILSLVNSDLIQTWFDLGMYYFNCQKYSETINCFDNSLELRKNISKASNFYDQDKIVAIKNICLEMVTVYSEPMVPISTKCDFSKIKDINNGGVIAYDYFCSILSVKENDIKTFYQQYVATLDSNSKEFQIVKCLTQFLYVLQPEHAALITELTSGIPELKDFKIGEQETLGDSPVLSGCFSAINIQKSFPSPDLAKLFHSKIQTFLTEHELVQSSTYQQIEHALNRLHSQKKILYSKKNLLIAPSLLNFTNPIEDPFIYDLINVVFTKVENFKKIRDYKPAMEILNDFFKLIKNMMDDSQYVRPFLPSLSSIILDELLVISVLLARESIDRGAAVLVQCRQFVQSFPTGSFLQHNTVIYPLSLLINASDFTFLSSLVNTHLDQSLKRFTYLLILMANSLNNATEMPEETKEVWTHIQIMINENPTFPLNIHNFLKFIKLILNPMIRNLIHDILISIFNIKSEMKMKLVYSLNCRFSESTFINMDILAMMMEKIFKQSTKIDPLNLQWQACYAHILFYKKLYRKALFRYASLAYAINSPESQELTDINHIATNMIICCQQLKRHDHAFLTCCIFRLYNHESTKKVVESAAEFNQNINKFLTYVDDIDLLEYLSERAIDDDDDELIADINVVIRNVSLKNPENISCPNINHFGLSDLIEEYIQE